MVNIVQQGQVGVVKRLGEYRKTHDPGLVVIIPFAETLQTVDMREVPVPGDRQEVVTDKWGIRISRIEIVEIAPPPQILQALALQKQADQEKRARILQSEGEKQSAINVAQGDAQANVAAAEGEKKAAILRAEGASQAAVLEAEGRARAIATVYTAIKEAQPDQ